MPRLERGATPQLDTLMDYMDGYSYEIVLVPRGSTVTVEG